MALKAGRVGVYPQDLDKEGHIKQPEIEPYVLPVATSEVLGGVKPVSKTEAMTQDVGVDSEGKLYAPAGGGDIYTKTFAVNLTTGASDNYIYSNSVAVSGYTPISVTLVDTATGYLGVGSLYKNRDGNGETRVVARKPGTYPNSYNAIVYYVKNENIKSL